MRMEKNLTPDQIIDALGGTSEVARLCAVSDPSVSQWRKAGIPADMRRIDQLAAQLAQAEEARRLLQALTHCPACTASATARLVPPASPIGSCS